MILLYISLAGGTVEHQGAVHDEYNDDKQEETLVFLWLVLYSNSGVKSQFRVAHECPIQISIVYLIRI